jgi:hypothetical protein
MATLYSAGVDVLSGIVGPIPAKMCMSSACIELNKTAETLADSDFDAVAQKIRDDMSRFASPELLEAALRKIKEQL